MSDGAGKQKRNGYYAIYGTITGRLRCDKISCFGTGNVAKRQIRMQALKAQLINVEQRKADYLRELGLDE